MSGYLEEPYSSPGTTQHAPYSGFLGGFANGFTRGFKLADDYFYRKELRRLSERLNEANVGYIRANTRRTEAETDLLESSRQASRDAGRAAADELAGTTSPTDTNSSAAAPMGEAAPADIEPVSNDEPSYGYMAEGGVIGTRPTAPTAPTGGGAAGAAADSFLRAFSMMDQFLDRRAKQELQRLLAEAKVANINASTAHMNAQTDLANSMRDWAGATSIVARGMLREQNGAAPPAPATSAPSTAPAPISSSGPIDRQAAARTAYQDWLDLGMAPHVAAGLTANEYEESGFDPKVYTGARRGDGSKALGAFQWHPDRQAAIERQFGKPITAMTPTEQRRALAWEMSDTGPEARAGQEIARGRNAEEAGQLVSKYLLRPYDPTGQVAARRGRLAARMSDNELMPVPPIPPPDELAESQ
jgi:hypothetical protein